MTDYKLSEQSHIKARQQMIRLQLSARNVSDPQVLKVMGQLPRELFIPEQWRHAAYEDRAVPIGSKQTISQPYMVAFMTQKLQLSSQHKVLEIGTGCGYQTAILAKLVAQVYTIERIEALSQRARTVLETLQIKNVHYLLGDGCLGWEQFAPYDRIMITAGAPDVPELLSDQLCDGGIMIVPTGPVEGQTLMQVVKQGPELKKTALLGCRFVKLYGRQAWPEEQFDYQ